ncbi:hypothetical protein [Actinophytocola gossypii]|uniref:Uncharacterized protein n=1 Tax=Actinophytocola gossypii TaxID=2812003 RepID=A0ABT2JEK2_9PSEU|nr:hypothetical protein [Actinophytocola gossypii]MCT2586304.1 hypothetical protein [Actinophytocola gossypii]
MTAGGFIEIDLDAVEQVFRRLDATGATLDTEWRRARLTVHIGEAGIGHDEIARSFRIHYGPASGAAFRAADNLPRSFTTLTTAGRAGAAEYRAADERGAAAINGKPPMLGPR